MKTMVYILERDHGGRVDLTMKEFEDAVKQAPNNRIGFNNHNGVVTFAVVKKK